MNLRPEAKLDELRMKTDRELVTLISNRLDHGLAYVRVLESDESRQRWSSMGHFISRAEEALSEATTWLRLLSASKPLERSRLELKLTQLRDALRRAGTSQVHMAAC